MGLEMITARNIPAENKSKAVFVLKTKGKTLTDAVREMTEQLAKEFDEKYGNQN